MKSQLFERSDATECMKYSVCVISPNPLAAEYLVRILKKHHSLCPILYHDLPENPTSTDSIVLVVDTTFPQLPLGEYLAQLRSRFTEPRGVIVGAKKSANEAAQLLKAGIYAFVEHSAVARTLGKAVLRVAKGDLWFSDFATQFDKLIEDEENNLARPCKESPRDPHEEHAAGLIETMPAASAAQGSMRSRANDTCKTEPAPSARKVWDPFYD